MAAHCYDCHEGLELEGALDLTTMASLLRGGENGPAIVRGNAAQSNLFDMIDHGDMPPDENEKMSTEQISLIQRWINEGAPADEQVIEPLPRNRSHQAAQQHWAFFPLTLPEVPWSSIVQSAKSIRSGENASRNVGSHNTDRARSPMDVFILEKLYQHGLDMSPDTDRRRLIRRIYFDAVGLPPPSERVDHYVTDQRPDATARLLDRLLASPHLGVRWGRHWLDIVGYTDTISFDDDYGPPIGFTKGKWRYRDYVVQSWNEDKPYDRFLTEQLAGDEMVPWRTAKQYTPKILEHLVATGYFRCCEDISLEDNRPFIIWSVLHDTVSQIGTSVLGLTLTCARCHSHKFEPVSQQDYYSLMAMIAPALNVPSWKNPQARALPDVAASTLDEINRHNGELDKQVASVNQRIAAIKATFEAKLREEKLVALPETIREDTKSALATPAEQRSEIQKYLAEKLEALLAVKPEEVDAAIDSDGKQKIAEYNQQIAQVNSQRRSHGWIMGMYDVGSPPSTRLLKRGDYLLPRREVPPQILSALSNPSTDHILAHFTTPMPEGTTDEPAVPFVRSPENSGRRTALAHWMTDSRSPASGLVARVMANRIWQHCWAKESSPRWKTWGVSGAAPTHPELLEWLAADFRDSGWSPKRVMRQIMSSSVYQQATTRVQNPARIPQNVGQQVRQVAGDAPDSIDPGDELLWRARLRRLEAEAIRDAILTANGRLDDTLGGAPVPLEYHPDGRVIVATQGLPTQTSQWRRTLYLLNRRIYNPSFLSIFDKPIVTAGVCQRDDAAVALQPLAMMNDAFVAEQAAQLAQRVVSVAGTSTEGQLELVFRLALSRQPVDVEREWSRELIGQQAQLFADGEIGEDRVHLKALTELCHMLLNTNEFLYLE